MVRKVNTSTSLAPVLSVGAVALGQSTDAGQVTVRDPVPSWRQMRVKLQAVPLADGLLKVKVQLAVSVISKTLPSAAMSSVFVAVLVASVSCVFSVVFEDCANDVVVNHFDITGKGSSGEGEHEISVGFECFAGWLAACRCRLTYRLHRGSRFLRRLY